MTVGDVLARVAAAERNAGLATGSVTLVGVSKTVPLDRITAALDGGLTDLGENRAQELLSKAPTLGERESPPTWHFVGRLQRNKVASLAPWIALWHSIDSEKLGAAVARRVPGARVLVEVNLGQEPDKGGCNPTEVGRLTDALGRSGLDVAGLMTVAPRSGEAKRWFAQLRELALPLGLTELSMGMSGDFEDAIQEGATIVRVGTAIFGSR